VTDEPALLAAQNAVHDLIARQAPLAQTLEAISHCIGIVHPGAVVAFMCFDPARCSLSMFPSEHFSASYFDRLQEVPVGSLGACFGAAAYLRRQVITEDIETDPRWEAFRAAALGEGFRACWSSPVITAEGELLGIFGTYFRQPAAPSETGKLRLRQAAALIALAAVRDRDSRRHRTLAESHRSLFVNHPDGVYEFDLEGRFQRCNAALERIIGYLERELIGHHFNEYVEPDARAFIQAAFDAAKAGDSRQYEARVIHADGHAHQLEITNFPVTSEGEIVGVYGICRDITRERNQEAQIAYQASHDLLTGLPNRAALDDRLEQDLEWARQNRRLLAVLHLDLDGFKAINDGLGYRLGNLLLAAVAERLHPLLGPRDTLARFTGDEFAFLMPALGCREEVAAAAERILATFEPSFEIEGRALHISTSIGVACSDEPVQQVHELLQHADLALDVAKQQGRNTWQWHRSKGARVVSEHVLLRHDLHAALRDGQFELYYQPVVEAVTGRIRSVEALIRWHHPVHGVVSPGVFIPIAEQTGQIIPLGRWVLCQACRSLAERVARGEHVCPVAVNISSLQFRRDGFLEEVQGILDETGLPPELLELEMTESILMGGAEQAIEMICTLRGMRISVAIDDFGTGFSSLSYLRDLPIHKIKLDRAFIQDILTSRRNAAIVQGIITMAHHMDLVVVAEGIETPAQQQELVRRGCDMLQGFHFSRPVPLTALMALPDLLPARPCPDPTAAADHQ